LIKRLFITVLSAVALSACNGGSSGTTDVGDTTAGTTAGETTGGETTSGTTGGGTDAAAEQYKIVVQDVNGNGYERILDPVAAGCQTGEGDCVASTCCAEQ